MRAVVCDRLGDPSVLKIEERPVPEIGPADVLIKVGAASVNFPDVLMLSADYQHKTSGKLTERSEEHTSNSSHH